MSFKAPQSQNTFQKRFEGRDRRGANASVKTFGLPLFG
jgi:hypothetical protein